MMERIRSTVEIKSNLQALSENTILNDSKFLSSVRDPKGLEIMKNMGLYLSPIQRNEFESASDHCVFALKDDYPNGTIIDGDGNYRVVCKCINTGCHLFCKCRPDFKEDELAVLDENRTAKTEPDSIPFRVSQTTVAENDNSENGKADYLQNIDVVETAEPDSEYKDISSAPADEQPAGERPDVNKTTENEKTDYAVDDHKWTEEHSHSEEDRNEESTVPSVSESNWPEDGTDSTAETQRVDSSEIPCKPTEENGEKQLSVEAEVQPTTADIDFRSFISVEQDQIIEQDPKERTIVNAGPGTGKTWTLIEKVKFMLGSDQVDAEDILVLCFSRAAVDVVKSRLGKASDDGSIALSWKLVEVRTLDSFASSMLFWTADNRPELLPRDFSLEGMDYDQRIEIAASVLKKDRDMLAGYRHVIIDEVQDIVGVRAEMVLALLRGLPCSCGFTLLGDSCQAIYDYLAEDDPGFLSSTKFYRELFHEFREVNYYTLNKNFRQSNGWEKVTGPYRESILTGNPADRAREVASLSSMIDTADVNLKHFTENDASEYTKQGTLGILTRTNGQALQISTWLQNEGVGHRLLRRANNSFAEWISRVIIRAESDVLSKAKFQSVFEELYPDQASESLKFWDALTAFSTRTNGKSDYFDVEDLLRGLLQTHGNSVLLYENPQRHYPAITVSNIHRAKGREFDNVLVVENIISQLAEPEEDNELEHRVCYVALTRPRKSLKKVDLEDQYIYIMKDDSRRCFKGGGFMNNYKKYLSHFEVGFDGDLEERSFAENEERQEQIKRLSGHDERLKLIKCPENPAGVLYRLVPEDHESIVLGYTGEQFCRDMFTAICRVFNNPWAPMRYKYFPDILGDIYIDRITTCISADGSGIPGAKQFGNMYMWNGISIEGFAQSERDRY